MVRAVSSGSVGAPLDGRRRCEAGGLEAERQTARTGKEIYGLDARGGAHAYPSGAGRWAGEEVVAAQQRFLVGGSSLPAAFVVVEWSTLAASPILAANSPLFVAGRPLSALEIPVLGAHCPSGREKCRKSTENAAEF